MSVASRTSRFLARGASGILGSALAGTLLAALAAQPLLAQPAPSCSSSNTVTADVVALDQLFFYNRYGAHNPGGMIFALRRDVVDSSGRTEAEGGTLSPGNVSMREDKRVRPLVLRVNEGECLTIHFQNLLAPVPEDNEQPATRTASVHVMGLSYVNGPGTDDGAFVGTNPSSLVAPGQSATYTVYADKEASHLLYSAAATTGGEGDGGSLAMGLFGAVIVEPAGAEWYRSQLTRDELDWATVGTLPSGHPEIDYDAVYPAGHRFEGLPILNIRHDGEIVHSELTALITGPGRGAFPPDTFHDNPVLEPNKYVPQAPGLDLRTREEPFREFTIIFHDEIFAIQAFPEFEDEVGGLAHTLHGVRDGFAINYGTAGLGAEILANRKGVGPVAGCNECKYEEFFLTSWVVGDPAMIVDVPAGAQDPGDPDDRATVAYYPDDPSNVYHSYIGDHVRFRNIHAGPAEHHIFHLHAHQWVFAPDSDSSAYLDSQAIGPGSTYTYEITYNGGGNRNQTAGDSIFHCHLYPHFAQGMWSLWRVHDVFEQGTELDGDGRPVPGSRALPDAEIATGTPIPAVVPLPTLAMAPLPGEVEIQDGQVVLADTDTNPGYPFFIPGRAGHRPPQPPLELLDDGGLPRHVVTDGETEFPAINRLDFSKDNTKLAAEWLDPNGTAIEQTAMAFHAERTHPSYTPEGTATEFVTNGLPPAVGAPYADPCVDDRGMSTVRPDGSNSRTYAAAAFQVDVVLNKVGTHYPQSRILALWDDVQPTIDRTKPPEPLFFRANSGDCLTYYLTNLLPNVFEMDDYQVRTPTDTVGQHIHLVKFDVTASDGAANGYNYEDGSFSPGEVIERIEAIRHGIDEGLPGATVPPGKDLANFVPQPHDFFGSGLGLGAQTTVQRWYVDPVTNLTGNDRTLRSVFTHDHFAPSTQQQVGYYGGLLIEPADCTWRDPETGGALGTREDGGPTSWRADILTEDPAKSYREFAFAFSDFNPAL
jgi:manganese oxidase